MTDDQLPPPMNRSAGFFVRTLSRHYISEPMGQVLQEIASTLDLIDELQRELNKAGAVVGGQPSPLAIELRQQRLLLARLIAMLPAEEPLPSSPGVPPPPRSPASMRASKAARTRWDRFHAIRNAVG